MGVIALGVLQPREAAAQSSYGDLRRTVSGYLKTSPSGMAVGIITMRGTPWKLEDNFRKLESYVRQAAKSGAQLVIAPESILDGYVCSVPHTTKERMLTVAQTVPDGGYILRGRALSKELGIYLIFGFLERIGAELYNSCLLLDPHGEILAKYQKVEPSGESYITPGHELRPFDTPIGRVGFLICSDRWVPENFRVLGVQGVQVVFLPMDGGMGPSGAEHTQMLRRRAMDNFCWIISANTWSTLIINPQGEVVLERYEKECVTISNLDLSDTPKGQRRKNMVNRRPDLYGPLMKSSEAQTTYDEEGRPTPFEEERRAKSRNSGPESVDAK